VVEEEADESAYWLELIVEGELLKQELVEPLLNEANELARIMSSSRISTSASLSHSTKRQLPIGNRKSAMN
jgi:four helix bundle protein